MKRSKLTRGVCSRLVYFEGLAYYTVPGKLLPVDVVLQLHLLLWALPKALFMYPKFPGCVGVLCAQGSAGSSAGCIAKHGAIFSECFFWYYVRSRSL